MIIGLTGKNGSGKGAVADYLKSKGYEHYSLSDVLRDEARARGLEISRDNLYAIGNELRSALGAGVLAKKVLVKLHGQSNIILDSIRHPAEVEVLRTLKNFKLIVVQASPEVRFERMCQRARENDPTDFKSFLALEEKESQSQTASDQQLDKTLKQADIVIKNDSSLETLNEQVEEFLQEFSPRN
jgi:dephospho-CoA kinase